MFVTDEWAIERTGKHRTTVLRWRLAGTWPPELQRLARLELDGELGLIHPAWEGWKLDARTAELCAPLSRLSFAPGQLLAIPLREQLVHALERDLGLLRRDRVPLGDQRNSGRRARFVPNTGFVCVHCGASDRRRDAVRDDRQVIVRAAK